MATPLKNTFKRGYSSVYFLMVEGIPYTFVEKEPLRVDADSAPSAASGRTTVKGLIIDQSPTISMEVDRKAGIGRGASVTFTLGYKDLERAGVLDDIFARATLQTEITADVSATATSVTADTTGFPSSGNVYFGREYISYTGTGSAFTGCTRGVVGYPYKHEANSVSQSRWITNKPLIWRGRFVTLYEAICDREGRILDSQWGTGDYTREIWKGYIEKPPIPGSLGMDLECLPLCRLLGNPVGYKVKWEDDRLHYPFTNESLAGSPFPAFYDEGTGFVTLKITFTGSSSGSATSPMTINVSQTAKQYFSSPDLWCLLFASDIETAVKATLPEFTFTASNYLQPASRTGKRLYFSGSGAVTVTQMDLTVSPASAPYFLKPSATTTSGDDWLGKYIEMEFRQALNQVDDLPYLIVQKLTGNSAQDFDPVAPGIGVLTQGEDSEIVRWDAVVDADTFTSKIGIRLSERGVGGSPVVDIVPEGFTLEAGVGGTGTVYENTLEILESSGSPGVRGAYDKLALGFGLGVPEALIDVVAMKKMEFSYFPAVMMQSGQASAGDLIGGWVAASGNCIINYRDSGVQKLKPVNTGTAKFSSLQNNVEALTTADVLLDRVDPVRVIDPPNPVEIDTSSMLNESAKITVRDSVAIQEQGAHPMSLNCPGMTLETALAAGRNFIYLGSGQYAISLGVGPWVDVQAGDPVLLNIGHPAIYDWTNGTTGPASVPGRVMGWERDLVTNEQRLTIVLNGAGQFQNLLCPVGVVASKAGDTVTLTSGIEWFTAGDSVILYNRGEEALGTPEIETLVIDSISGSVITFTTTPASWVALNTRITFPNVSAATTDQDDFFFNSSDYRWSG